VALQRGTRGTVSVGILTAAAVGLLAWLYYCWRLSLTVPAGLDLFDFANNLLYGDDIRHGNFLLHGWVVTQDPHWLTDDLAYAAGIAARGLDPALLHAVPVAMYTVLIVLAAWAAVTRLRLSGRERLLVSAVAALPLVFPSRTLAAQVLLGPYHTDTTAAALGAVIALAPCADGERPAARAARNVVGGVLLAIGRIGDPYMLALGVVPILLVGVYFGIVEHARPWRTPAGRPFLIALAAWVCAAAALALVPRLGGFTMRASLAPLIPLSELGPRLLSFLGTFLDLSGGNIFGLSFGSLLVVTLIRLAYASAAAWAVVRVLGDLRRGRERDWTTAVLAVAVVVSAVGTFLYGPGDYLGDEHRTPVFLLMGIVLARYLATRHRAWFAVGTADRRTAAGLAVCALAFAALPLDQLQHPQGFDDPAHFAQLVLARWLDQRGFQRGYGPYDEASIVMVETRGRVTVRPLISTGRYGSPPRNTWRLIPNIELMANSAWYTAEAPATFLIVDGQDVDADTAVATFGRPDRVYAVAGWRVFTWDDGIVCTLPDPTPDVLAEEADGTPPASASCRRAQARAAAGPTAARPTQEQGDGLITERGISP
jgi:hypothetical protein